MTHIVHLFLDRETYNLINLFGGPETRNGYGGQSSRPTPTAGRDAKGAGDMDFNVSVPLVFRVHVRQTIQSWRAADQNSRLFFTPPKRSSAGLHRVS